MTVTDFKWVCWECDAGDHFLCQHDEMAAHCECECRDGRDAFLIAVNA